MIYINLPNNLTMSTLIPLIILSKALKCQFNQSNQSSIDIVFVDATDATKSSIFSNYTFLEKMKIIKEAPANLIKINEPSPLIYNKIHIDPSKNYLLSGNFISYKYFQKYKSFILNDIEQIFGKYYEMTSQDNYFINTLDNINSNCSADRNNHLNILTLFAYYFRQNVNATMTITSLISENNCNLEDIFPNTEEILRTADRLENTYIINLDTRKDRQYRVIPNVKKISKKYEIFNAMKNTYGALGCTLSHIEVLKNAIKNNLEYVFIAEDDIKITNEHLILYSVDKIMKTYNWDVIILAGVIRNENSEGVRSEDKKYIAKTRNSQTTAGYIVNKPYFQTLLSNFIEGYGQLNTTRNKQYAIDIHWKKLQMNDNWFCLRNGLCAQEKDFSDIENIVVDYKTYNFSKTNFCEYVNDVPIIDLLHISYLKNIPQYYHDAEKIIVNIGCIRIPDELLKVSFDVVLRESSKHDIIYLHGVISRDQKQFKKSDTEILLDYIGNDHSLVKNVAPGDGKYFAVLLSNYSLSKIIYGNSSKNIKIVKWPMFVSKYTIKWLDYYNVGQFGLDQEKFLDMLTDSAKQMESDVLFPTPIKRTGQIPKPVNNPNIQKRQLPNFGNQNNRPIVPIVHILSAGSLNRNIDSARQKKPQENIQKRQLVSNTSNSLNKPIVSAAPIETTGKEKILVISLMGGLGNILFQLASSYALSEKYNYKLKIHVMDIGQHKTTDYNFINKFDLWLGSPGIRVIYESGDKCTICHDVLGRNTNVSVRLIGYLQNEKYFSKHREKLIDMFVDETIISDIKSRYCDMEKAYFIHIRRGDYLDLNLACDHRYYTKSISYVLSKEPSSMFYIFSDDIDYCKSSNIFDDIKNNNKIFVDEKNEVIALHMMSMCKKGGICSNSTFSWWGGYLNKNAGRKLYFPSKWFNDNRRVDIYPKNCIIIDGNNILEKMKFTDSNEWFVNKNNLWIVPVDNGSGRKIANPANSINPKIPYTKKIDDHDMKELAKIQIDKIRKRIILCENRDENKKDIYM